MSNYSLQHLEDLFIEQGVEYEDLLEPDLSDSDLQKIGVQKFADRKKILKASKY